MNSNGSGDKPPSNGAKKRAFKDVFVDVLTGGVMLAIVVVILAVSAALAVLAYRFITGLV